MRDTTRRSRSRVSAASRSRWRSAWKLFRRFATKQFHPVFPGLGSRSFEIPVVWRVETVSSLRDETVSPRLSRRSRWCSRWKLFRRFAAKQFQPVLPGLEHQGRARPVGEVDVAGRVEDGEVRARSGAEAAH